MANHLVAATIVVAAGSMSFQAAEFVAVVVHSGLSLEIDYCPAAVEAGGQFAQHCLMNQIGCQSQAAAAAVVAVECCLSSLRTDYCLAVVVAVAVAAVVVVAH